MGQVFLILSYLSDIFPTFWKFLGEKVPVSIRLTEPLVLGYQLN